MGNVGAPAPNIDYMLIVMSKSRQSSPAVSYQLSAGDGQPQRAWSAQRESKVQIENWRRFEMRIPVRQDLRLLGAVALRKDLFFDFGQPANEPSPF